MTERWKWATVQQIKKAAEELKASIRARYPEASFQLGRAPDDQHIWFLWTFVDVDDTDQVKALTIDREAELLVEQNMLLHVVPVRSREEIFGHPPREVSKAV